MLSLFAAYVLCGGCAQSNDTSSSREDDETTDRAVAVLRQALSEEDGWVKVHAAEALVANGYYEGVRKTFLAELPTAKPKYRIGVWRVLAQASHDDHEEREKHINRIRDAFLNIDGPDREHALESLAKLQYSARPEELVYVAMDAKGTFQAHARWALANSGRHEDEKLLTALFCSEDSDVRATVAYGLRYLEDVSGDAIRRLEKAYAKEPADSGARIYILSALGVHCPPEHRGKLKEELLKYAEMGNAAEKKEAFAALAYFGEDYDIPFLSRRLSNETDTDIRIFCANALLKNRAKARGK